MNNQVASLDQFASAWQRLAGRAATPLPPRRTLESYSRMLQHFLGRVGKTKDRVTSHDLLAGDTPSLSVKTPGPVAMGRIASLSFYKSHIRIKVGARKPGDVLECARTPGKRHVASAPAASVRLTVVPSTPSGPRDRAMILRSAFTGRQRPEVMSMTAGSLLREPQI